MNVFGLVHSARARDQVLSSMQQILKERKQRLEKGKKEDTRFLPHYVFLIDEPKVLMDHSIMEYLGTAQEEPLGFSPSGEVDDQILPADPIA